MRSSRHSSDEPALGSDRYQAQRKDLEDRLFRRFKAADGYIELAIGLNEQILGDLWSHWRTPAAFAEKYPEWYRERWGVEIEDSYDWYGQDVNPWSHLQDCLGVRGLAVPVKATATLHEIMQALDDSRLALPDRSTRWLFMSKLPPDTPTTEFLRQAAYEFDRLQGLVLIEMVDLWSEDCVLTTVRRKDQPALQALAQKADIDVRGLRDLSA